MLLKLVKTLLTGSANCLPLGDTSQLLKSQEMLVEVAWAPLDRNILLKKLGQETKRPWT